MNWLDYLLLLALGWGAFRGGMKGFAVSVSSLFALYLAVILGFKGMHLATTWLSVQFDWNTPWLPFIGFLTVFVLVFAGILLLGRTLDRLFKAAALGWANRLAGALLGILQWILVAGTLLWLVDQVQLIEPEVKHGSKLYEPVYTLARSSWQLLERLWPAVGDWMGEIDKQFDALTEATKS